MRRVDNHEEVYNFDLNQVTGSNEIARLTPQPGGLEVVTTPDSTDSQLRFAVAWPIGAKLYLADQATRWIGVDVSVTLFALLAMGIILGLRAAFGTKLALAFRGATSKPPRCLVSRGGSAATSGLSRPRRS